MAHINVSGLSKEEKQLIKDAAAEAGMNTAQFTRTRFRAGYRLWKAGGEFDTHEMRSRLDDDLDESSESQTSSSEPASAAKHDRFAEQILRNLPTDEDDALPRDEVEDLVTSKVVGEVLDELADAGNIEFDHKQQGYVRTE
jgi:hypothetical protein